jgi:hypothetical protein
VLLPLVKILFMALLVNDDVELLLTGVTVGLLFKDDVELLLTGLL